MGQFGIKVSSKTEATKENSGSLWPGDSELQAFGPRGSQRIRAFRRLLQLCPISFLH